jgi:hypothetical protein
MAHEEKRKKIGCDQTAYRANKAYVPSCRTFCSPPIPTSILFIFADWLNSFRNQIATSNAAQVALITRPSAMEYTWWLTHISNQAQQTWDPGRKVQIRES